METKDLKQETPYKGLVLNGFMMLILFIAILVGMIFAAINISMSEGSLTLMCILTLAVDTLIAMGFMTLQPNQARVLIFFGKYKGTFTHDGFYWVNPFMVKKKISLRIRNMDVAPIKVNDKVGNPVMIGMVLVWKVKDTYRAAFDVDAGEGADKVSINAAGQTNINLTDNALSKALTNFVMIQSDAALREVTSQFAYDNEETDSQGATLRSGSDEIVEILESKLNDRLAMAGIEVVEARLNYLAYAPEIAAVMLRRQQASAVISAREKIVEGAVSMVKMALDEIEKEGMVTLDDERKAAMVSNLLVVLCADEPAQPVVNTSGLYH